MLLLLPCTLLLALSTVSHAYTPTHSPLFRNYPVHYASRKGIPIVPQQDAVVCGGGPAGLLTAIMLAQKLPPDQTIRVYDRLSAPPSPDDATVWNEVAKFYLIGLGARGQAALKAMHVWDAVQKRCTPVVGRKDWQPNAEEGVERLSNKSYTTQVLPRDKLVGCLHEYIVQNLSHRIELCYETEVTPLNFDYDQGRVLLQVTACDAQARASSAVKTASEDPEGETLCSIDQQFTLVSAGMVVAADGTVRTVANAMEKADAERMAKLSPLQRLRARPFGVTRYVDDNPRIYKTIPMQIDGDNNRKDLNYSARSNRCTIDALPANADGSYCAALLLKKEDPLAQADTDPEELRAMLKESFPALYDMMDPDLLDAVAKKPVSYLPSFRYAGPRLHQGNCVLLGDCAHTVKPYFGLGANSALEDVKILGDLLDEHKGDTSKAIRAFSKRRAPESKAMVRLSRELDRPGRLGFITFILPIILDSIFSQIAPKFFAPNVISTMQDPKRTFTQVARRKRQDRLVQLSVIGSFLVGATWMAKRSTVLLASVLGVKTWQLGSSLAAVAALSMGVTQLLKGKKLEESDIPAPADIIARVEKNPVPAKAA